MIKGCLAAEAESGCRGCGGWGKDTSLAELLLLLLGLLSVERCIQSAEERTCQAS